MTSTIVMRLVLGSAAALQAVTLAVLAAPVVVSGGLAGGALVVCCAAGFGSALRLLVVECVECRAVVLTLCALTLLGILLSITIGLPGHEAQQITPLVAIAGFASALAGVTMVVSRSGWRGRQPVTPSRVSQVRTR